MKKVHIQLKDNVHTKAKVISVLKGTTLNEYFEKALERAISRDKEVLNQMKE
jgi:transposase